LYASQGFEQTTAAQIAARAGVTERTFFRHFADKREALFGGSALLQERIVAGVPDPHATLAATAGMTVLRVAIQQWTQDNGDQGLTSVVREAVTDLRAVTAGY